MPDEDNKEVAIAKNPKNLILYGPPGTGKTFYLIQKILPAYLDNTSTEELRMIKMVEEISEQPWVVVLAFAIVDLGGSASVEELCEHPCVLKKSQAQTYKKATTEQIDATLRSKAFNPLDTRTSTPARHVVLFERDL